ncbi:hypothetical protein M3215_01190 [Bacillus cytotoxicus]|uniref:Uncharacterized protein n=1 Tax=Bacillus cytotoxicus TaxID=580165 RepID=A0ACC6A0R1_9BACI|nr:hypothetical protein [Bacillus cytotoxicus]
MLLVCLSISLVLDIYNMLIKAGGPTTVDYIVQAVLAVVIVVDTSGGNELRSAQGDSFCCYIHVGFCRGVFKSCRSADIFQKAPIYDEKQSIYFKKRRYMMKSSRYISKSADI